MFNLFKSKVDKNIYAPVKGKCIDITEVNDIGFASLSMGDGIAIIPDTHIIAAPCDGTVQMILGQDMLLESKLIMDLRS